MCIVKLCQINCHKSFFLAFYICNLLLFMLDGNLVKCLVLGKVSGFGANLVISRLLKSFFPVMK